MGFVKEHKKILGCEIMNEIIKGKVLSKDWTFAEISNLKSTIDTLSHEVYSEMNIMDRFQLARENKINDGYVGMTLEDTFRIIVMTHIKGEVAGTIRNMLDGATVNFGGNENEISEGSLGREPHQERPTDEKEDSILKE